MNKKTLIGVLVIVIVVGGVAAYYFLAPKPPAPMVILYNSGNTYREQIASILKTEWGKLGIRVTTQGVSWATYLDLIEGKDWDVYIIGWGPDYLDPDDYVFPLMYGGTVFSYLNYIITDNVSLVSENLKNAIVFEVENDWYVVVGEKGTGATVSIPSGSHLVIVPYTVDEENTLPREESHPWWDIDPSYYRNITADALILVGEEITDVDARTAVYQAIMQISNNDLPVLFLCQFIYAHDQWSWLHGFYFHPVLAPRYDLLWEDALPSPPEIGTYGSGEASRPSVRYYNNETVLSIVTFGFPDTFDPAANYETFGWEIFHQIGDTIVTYWKEETVNLEKDLAIAWVHDEASETWYFVIRDGVKAYNPWKDVLAANVTTDEVYDINATDILFTLWRIARLHMDPSWMIRSFIDVNASAVLNETEFDNILKTTNLTAEYMGNTYTPANLSDLLSFFGEEGTGTAGIVRLNLTIPYAAILSVLADPFTMVIPMKFIFQIMGKGDQYDDALADSDYGKDPSAWANYLVIPKVEGEEAPEEEPSHKILHKYVIGTGPFYIYEYGPAQDFIILKKNPYYWNSSIWNDIPNGGHNIIIYTMNDDAKTRETIYISGSADLGAIPLDRMEALNQTTLEGTTYKFIAEKDPDLLTIDITYVVWNTLKYPFNDTRIRKALAYAVPYQEIIDEVYSGYAIQLLGWIPKGMMGYTTKGITVYNYDLDKAREILEEVGFIKPWYYYVMFIPNFILGIPLAFEFGKEDEE